VEPASLLSDRFAVCASPRLFAYSGIYLPVKFIDVCSAHMRAHFLQDGIWIDLHLSITARKSSSILHDELATYIKALQMVKQ
jgi:hypothetical protein